MAQATVKNTHAETIVKVYGAASTTETIDINTLQATGQVVDGGTQTVNIVGVTWTGDAASVITITRNGTVVMTLLGSAADSIDFSGQQLPPEATGNTSDIVVAITGGVGQCWLKLRKIGGYKTTIEPEQFGSLDNPAVSGS